MAGMRRTCGLFLFCLGAASAQTLYETVQLGTESARRTTRPVARGKRYAVSSMDPTATQAAEHVLRTGGNAFDAIVAGQAVLGLVAPAANGIGGDAVLLVHEGKSGQVFSVNAEGTAPKLATIEWYRKHHNGKLPVNDGLLSGTVPGVVDAWYMLLSRWGTMSFEQVLAPAIEMAENGFPAPDALARSIADAAKRFSKYPSSLKTYLAEGKAPGAGDLWKNPQLARTMRRLVEAERGAKPNGRIEALKAARDRFYKGDIAREMARFSEENGGLFRYQDFASYTAKVETPVWLDYRGYRVYKNPSASQGPAELFVLSLLREFDLQAMGHNSPEYVHNGIEAVKLGFADRDKYLGDMDFIQIPYEGLLSRDYARERLKLIDPAKASLDLRPGKPEGFVSGMAPLDRPLDVDQAGAADHDGDTSYIAVVDQDRNGISFTPSLHSGFGTNVVMAELGFSFNCRGDYFSLVERNANALAPGKRPRSTLQGTLVTRAGKFFGVMGSPGGDDQCLRTLQTFLNIVEFGMNPQQAIEAPRWSTRSFPASPFPHTMYPGEITVESRIPRSTREALARKGHKVRVAGPWSLGSNAAIIVDPESGVLSAGADPRADAYALAW
ncbi:MAG: gamma-glutamyltransferase [Acidobacteria bacterium]|nr:gamma-glutamyltransferase [Acidobacteriota bacterium]